jgi:hypothetical protein
MFNKMDEGFTIKESFDLASAEFPTIADCVVFVGDINLIVDENQNPHIPTITGPTSGKPGVGYDYIFNAEDPNGDDVKYYIDWGDDNSETTGFNPSGTNVLVKHTWNEEGTYEIRVKAKDVNGAESNWATLQVSMPKNRLVNRPILTFLQQHLNLFPMLRQLLLKL